MSNPNWPTNWPKAVPFPTAIGRRRGPVPNRQAVDWPQSQLAPLYLSPGNPSFQPYRYPEGGPMSNLLPDLYQLPADAYPYAHSMVGPGGDIDQLPNQLPPSYGEIMPIYARRNQGEVSPDLVDQVLDSSVSPEVAAPILDAAASESIVAVPEATSLPEAAIQEAALAAESAIETSSALVPFTEAQMKGLRARTKARLKRLDKAIANLAAIETRTARQEYWFKRLSKLHVRLSARLDKRAARIAKAGGTKRWEIWKEFRQAKTERTDSTAFTKKEAIARVVAAYRNRTIDRDTAARLIRGVMAGEPKAWAIVRHPILARVVY